MARKVSPALQRVQWGACALGLSLGIGLTLTNPKQDAYTAFATKTVSQFLVKDLCRVNEQAPKLFDSFLKDGCKTLMQQGEVEIHAFIAHNTQRQDFFLFSLYTTDFPIRPLRVLGIFNQFFLIS
ncbi:MAG: DUF4359 domain-containing protein [Thermosynechococcaceae cyanobacterium]